MIEFTKAYVVDGKTFATLEEAQIQAIQEHFTGSEVAEPVINKDLAAMMIEQKEVLIDILTMKDSSRPKARAINGGKKARKAKTPPVTETLPGVEA